MRRLLILLLLPLLCLCFLAKFQFWDSAPSKAVQLGADNFTQAVEHGSWFIELYSPICPACETLAPIIEELAVSINQGDVSSSMHVARVNCAGPTTKFCRKLHLVTYPKLFLVDAGKMYEYEGDWTVSAIEQFLSGGWRMTEAYPLPPAPSAIENAVEQLSEIWLEYISIPIYIRTKRNPEILFGVIGVAGILLLVLVHRLASAPQKPVEKKKQN